MFRPQNLWLLHYVYSIFVDTKTLQFIVFLRVNVVALLLSRSYNIVVCPALMCSVQYRVTTRLERPDRRVFYESSFLSKGTVGLTSYTNQLQQRFIESYESFNQGSLIQNNSCESYNDWLERGCIFHFDFTRHESDRDTELQLNLQSLSDHAQLTNQKVFIVAWYRTRCEYQSSVGVIKSVKMGSI